jgi:CheY-like chemotaxis protein
MTAQNMGRKILSESGYDVTTVSNGAAAVKKIAEVKPDLVILDIYMPGYTGLEVCERVRANFDTANLPVLLTVGKMEPYRAEDGAKVRADGVIVKPFEATDLLAVVKKLSEKIPAAPVKPSAEEEPEQEESTFQQFSQPEPAMPSQVEVPAEIAVAPALAMEEFSTGQAGAFASPQMNWSAPVELVVEHPAPAETNHQFAEMPWSFDHPIPAEEPVAENSARVEVGPSPDVEFTSAPQVGSVEVEHAPELEAVSSEAPVEAEHKQEPELSNAQEITDFATSFGLAQGVESQVAEQHEVPAATDTSWNGWAHADPEPLEEAKPQGVIDDFEAKVAAAMSGFGTEAVEPAHEAATSEISAAPVDEFEARVAAAMSGFATEPVLAITEPVPTTPEAEPVVESHQDALPVIEAPEDFEARVAAAMSGFSMAEPQAHEPVVEAHEALAEPEPEAVAAPSTADDFDARLAEAMAAFDHTPEVPVEPEVTAKPEEETQEFEIPELPKPAINLNETMVLPQEAILSLEEEMNRAMEQPAPVVEETHAEATEPAPATISWEPPKPEAHEPEVREAETHAKEVVHSDPPLSLGEFDPMHVEHAADEVPHVDHAHVEVAAAAAASSMLSSAVGSNGNEKLADAVHRAIDRLKPQLIAEIVKELKGE